MVRVDALAIPDLKLITPRKFEDERGFFSETFNAHDLVDASIWGPFVQDNHSLSRRKGVVRGLHYQVAPRAQGKLVRVSRGSILDVAIDIRHGSPTYGRHVAQVLSAANWSQLWIPVGFAHGFCTLEDDTEVQYKVTDYYAPECDRGVLWNDPALGIDWPVPPGEAILSEKDRALPALKDAAVAFRFSGA